MKYPLLLAVLFSCIGMAPARQTPPSPSDTVQRATAALQTDNASICTPHATGAETPPTLHPDTAQPSARTQFIRPPYLRPGDTVGIVTPARKLSEKADTAKVRERFESWGLFRSGRIPPTASNPISQVPMPSAPPTCRR